MDTASSHKRLKQDRVRQIFIDTVCSIISSEGVSAVSVRRAADESGYALATLYKYFRNLEELLWHSRIELINAAVRYFQERGQIHIKTWDGLKKELRTFMGYFIDRPTVFRFLYFYQLDPTVRPAGASGDNQALAASMLPVIKFISSSQSENPKPSRSQIRNAEAAIPLIIYTMLGVLSLLIGGNDTMEADTVDHTLDQLCWILKNALSARQADLQEKT